MVVARGESATGKPAYSATRPGGRACYGYSAQEVVEVAVVGAVVEVALAAGKASRDVKVGCKACPDCR